MEEYEKRKMPVTNIRHITMKAVDFDFTYEGMHCFDGKERA